MLLDLDYEMGFTIHSDLGYEGDTVDYNMIEHILKDED